MRQFQRIIALGLFLLVIAASGQSHQRAIDSMIRIIPSLSDQDTNKIHLYNDLSKRLWEIDSYPGAMEYAHKAIELSTHLDFKMGLAAGLRRQGATYRGTGNYPKAIESFYESLQISESVQDTNGSFKCINNIGLIYCDQNDYTMALNYFWKAEKLKKDAFIYNNIGEAYYGQAYYNLSLEFFIKSLNLSHPTNNKREIARSLNNIASVYEQKKEWPVAIKYYNEALNIRNDLEDKESIAFIYGSLGEMYMKKGDYQTALSYENMSVDLSRSLGSLRLMSDGEKTISEIYEKMNLGMKAVIHHKLYMMVKDSLFNVENTKKTVRSEMNFDFKKKEDEERIRHEEEVRHKNFQRNSFILGFIIVMIFSIFVYRSMRLQKRAKETIGMQKKELEIHHKEITDNINYAQSIQNAMLTSNEYIKHILPASFILFKPRDVVSGDYYWAYKDDEYVYFATADSTGHGTSGAMMSMIGISLLNQIVMERKITRPDLVLNNLRNEIIKSFEKGNDKQKRDGMDMVFCRMSLDYTRLECACANNPLFIVRNNNTIIDIKADKCPVGQYEKMDPFTLTSTDLMTGDIIYTFSDGFKDQFGHATQKKLMIKRFKEWALELYHQPIATIHHEMETRFNSWKGSNDQTDDVTIFAIKTMPNFQYL